MDKNKPLTAAQIKALLTLIKIVKSMPEEEFIKRYASLSEDELAEAYLEEKHRQEGEQWYMKEFRVVEVESDGIVDNYAAKSLGEYVVERLQSMLLPDGRFKDKKLQAEFEVWLKNREAAVSWDFYGSYWY